MVSCRLRFDHAKRTPPLRADMGVVYIDLIFQPPFRSMIEQSTPFTRPDRNSEADDFSCHLRALLNSL